MAQLTYSHGDNNHLLALQIAILSVVETLGYLQIKQIQILHCSTAERTGICCSSILFLVNFDFPLFDIYYHMLA